MDGAIRVVIAESEASRAREIAERVMALGYEVVARVASGREAVDAVSASDADVALFDIHLADGLGIFSAVAATRVRVGTAALVLTPHPAAADRGSRPRWGAVELVSAEAADEELDQDIRDMVIKARALAGLDGASPEYDTVALDEPVDESDVLAEPVLDPQETVERAIAQIVERTRLTPADALKLMEEEAVEDGRDLVEVAAAVLANAA